MIRAGKKLFLFSTVFICVLMVTAGMNGSLVCNAANQAYSSELTAPEKALAIFNDIVGIDIAAYNITLDLHNQDLFFETLPQEHVKFTLESKEGKLELHCNFVNEKLQSLDVYVLNGSPQMTQPATNVLDMAKGFLDRYQTYSGASYIEEMKGMMVDANENVTKTSGNTKLEVKYSRNPFSTWGNGAVVSFRWKYEFNGIEVAHKCVSLGFENGYLEHFTDKWDLYKIGSYDINISEEEAIEIAMNAAKNYSWNVSMGGDKPPVTVTEFNIVGVSETKLTFGNGVWKKEARGGDPLTLYPGWHIYLYFDKLYPGYVYGLSVGIWADTGEIRDITPMFLMGPNGDSTEQESSESNNETGPNLTPIAWMALPISIAIALGAIKVYSKRKKRIPHEVHNMPKLNSLKLGGALCLLISLTIFSMAMPTVEAGTYGITFYGSRWSMIQAEQDAAHAVIDHMEYNFALKGYTCYDYYGSLTQKQTVLSRASTMEEAFDHVAMFHHGHAGKDYVQDVLHWDYFDDTGGDYLSDQIWDYEVWPKTWRSKHFFVMLWACWQGDLIGYMDGNGRAVGMPYAWHRILDPSGDCFIGFKGASIPLTQKSQHDPTVIYRDFVMYFDYYALYAGYSIIGALHEASDDLFDLNYYETELYNGFTAKWPNLQLVKNMGFERGDASHWTIGGYGDHRVTSEDRHSGSYSMLLGYKYSDNVANARDYAYQLITIPEGATDVKFSFWYHLFTYDSVDYDWFEVYVVPVGGDPHLVFKKGGLDYPGLEEYGWSKVTTDLSAYAGQSIYLYFAVANWYDTAYKTWCYIDDVSVTFLGEGAGQMMIYGNPNLHL